MMLIIALACALAAAVSYLSARFAVIPILQRRGVLDHPTARSSHDEPVARGGGIAVFAGLVAGCATALVAQAVSAQGVEPGSEVTPFAAAARGGSPVRTSGSDRRSQFPVGCESSRDSGGPGSRRVRRSRSDGDGSRGVRHSGGRPEHHRRRQRNELHGWPEHPRPGVGCWDWAVVRSAGSGGRQRTARDRHHCLDCCARRFPAVECDARPASFLGDVGSYAIGRGFLSVGAWVLWSDGAPATALFAPFVVPMLDVLYTLGRRIYRRENLFTAHRSHIYQKLQTAGLSHEQVSAVHLLATGVCVAAALPVLFAAPVYDPLIAVAVWSGVIIGYAAMPTIVSRRQSRKPA